MPIEQNKHLRLQIACRRGLMSSILILVFIIYTFVPRKYVIMFGPMILLTFSELSFWYAKLRVGEHLLYGIFYTWLPVAGITWLSLIGNPYIWPAGLNSVYTTLVIDMMFLLFALTSRVRPSSRSSQNKRYINKVRNQYLPSCVLCVFGGQLDCLQHRCLPKYV